MAHTEIELSPWIQIDLLTNHFVYGVKIWNRSETSSQGILSIHYISDIKLKKIIM